MASNPIISVDGVAVTPPRTFRVKISDISSEDAGRTEDYVMHKLRQARLRTLSVSWQGLTQSQAETILEAFEPEYVTIVYKDPKDGQRSGTFYTGDMDCTMWETGELWESISFNLPEQIPEYVTSDEGA